MGSGPLARAARGLGAGGASVGAGGGVGAGLAGACAVFNCAAVVVVIEPSLLHRWLF